MGFFKASLRFGSSESHWASWSCKLARCPPPEECRRTRRCDLSAKGIYSLTLLPHGHICGPHCRPHSPPPPFLCRSPGGGDAPRDFRLLSSPSAPSGSSHGFSASPRQVIPRPASCLANPTMKHTRPSGQDDPRRNRGPRFPPAGSVVASVVQLGPRVSDRQQ